MAVKKVLARGWKFEVDDGQGGGGFVEIKGINSFTPSPTKTDADTTDFQSMGIEEHLPAARGFSVTLDGFYLEDPSDGTRDSGQARAEALSDEVGVDGIAPFRMTSPGGTTYTFNASFNVTIGGGGNNDASGWSVEVTRSGAVSTGEGEGEGE